MKITDGMGLFGFYILFEDDFIVANPSVFGQRRVTDTVKVVKAIEEEGYQFQFTNQSALYFKKVTK